MTTTDSSRGPTEVINARRTESVDAPHIHDLIATRTLNQFGHVNIVHLIEKSNLSVTLNNDENEILGFAGFLDYPQVEVCDSANWEGWMQDRKYDVAGKATPLNSLFMHFFVAKDDYTIGCGGEIVRTVFNAVPELRFIFLTLRSEMEPEAALKELFTPVNRKTVGGSPHNLYLCHRHHHVPLLHIRRAVVEDHDDLMPIFKRLNNNLTQTYGNYFLAEMIEAQDENNCAMVAEVHGKAIGFMSVCSHVNIELLQNCFELDSFHGLCKPHPGDILEPERPEKEECGEAEKSGSAARASITSISDVHTQDSETSVHSDADAAEKNASSDYPIAGDHANRSVSADTGGENITTPAPSQTSMMSGSEATVTHPKLSELHMGTSSSSLIQEDSVLAVDGNNAFYAETPTSSQDPVTFTATYEGESNAFSIQLFCIHEQYEMRSADFLPEIFKLFPHKDIVVITVPHLVPEFPLLQQFVRITPKTGSNAPQELYAFHRHGLIASAFKVRAACSSDYQQVETLVKNIQLKENLLHDLQLFNSARRDPDGTTIQAYVADCLDQVVGICIIRREEEIEYIRSHYNVEDFIYFNHHRRDEHAHLHHFALNPIFQHYAKHLMKEVLRLAHKSCLYYPVYPENKDKDNKNMHSLITGLNFMVPVRSRRQIEYPLDELGINAPSERVIAKVPPYALNHINRKLTLEPKVTINARIVVVGASDVGIAFLENLCFCPHLRFNNLTLVSKRGLPQLMRSTAFSYSEEDLAHLSLRSWVNVVQGIMEAIDRPRKQVVMADGAHIPYDHLVLCTGQQFQVPAPTEADVESMTNHDLEKGVIIRPYDISLPVPENVLTLNDDGDYHMLNQWTSRMAKRLTCTGEGLPAVVVYGSSIEAYAAIQMLLVGGISGSRLVLARPPPHYTSLSVCDDGCDGDPFNEPTVADAVKAALHETEVRVMDNLVLAQWELEDTISGSKVVSLSFTTPDKPVWSLPCVGFISLHPRRINHKTFLAANDSCLVFDGRLAIDATFKTNDPYIRAAGPLTKYTRRYYADSCGNRHENYSSREIGFRLAMTLLPIFDPTLEGSREILELSSPSPTRGSAPQTPAISPENIQNRLVPVYSEPKVTYCILPGSYEYLHIRKPGERPTFAAQMGDDEHGREMITGSPERGNYFRIHVNQYHRVETITCLTKTEEMKIPVGNLLRLYGLHQKYLNNLVSRFDEGLIRDFYAFFRDPWAIAFFHDRFQDFRHEVRDLLSAPPPGASNVLSVEAYVRQLAEEDFAITDQQRAALQLHYTNTGQQRKIEARLLSYLSYNYYHLPMYAKPGMV